MGLENNCREETYMYVSLYICIKKNQESAKAYFQKTYEITQLKDEKMARTWKLVTEFNLLEEKPSNTSKV